MNWWCSVCHYHSHTEWSASRPWWEESCWQLSCIASGVRCELSRLQSRQQQLCGPMAVRVLRKRTRASYGAPRMV